MDPLRLRILRRLLDLALELADGAELHGVAIGVLFAREQLEMEREARTMD